MLIYPDVRAAVAWIESAFGFEERVRIGEAHRAQLRIGSDGALVVADIRSDQVAPSGGIVTHLVKVRVPDVDAAFARARDFGARALEEPKTHEYGERSCVFEDLAGRRWGTDRDGPRRRARGMGWGNGRALVGLPVA